MTYYSRAIWRLQICVQ